MSDKWSGQQEFWSSFGIPAYDEDSVPKEATMPYITYHAATSGFENPIPLNASIWYRSTSWRDISQKAEEIAETLRTIHIVPIGDREYIALSQGTPFAQRMRETDSGVRKIYINVMAEFYTHH